MNEEIKNGTQRSFHDLFVEARKSPIYWMYGLEIHFGEWIVKYRKRLKRLESVIPGEAIVPRSRHYQARELRCALTAIERCRRHVRAELKRFEALPENRKLNRRKQRKRR